MCALISSIETHRAQAAIIAALFMRMKTRIPLISPNHAPAKAYTRFVQKGSGESMRLKNARQIYRQESRGIREYSSVMFPPCSVSASAASRGRSITSRFRRDETPRRRNMPSVRSRERYRFTVCRISMPVLPKQISCPRYSIRNR